MRTLIYIMLMVLVGCSTVTRTITDPNTGIVETTEAKSLLRKGAISIQDGAGATVITDQTITPDIINSARGVLVKSNGGINQ